MTPPAHLSEATRLDTAATAAEQATPPRGIHSQ